MLNLNNRRIGYAVQVFDTGRNGVINTHCIHQCHWSRILYHRVGGLDFLSIQQNLPLHKHIHIFHRGEAGGAGDGEMISERIEQTAAPENIWRTIC